ncbi:polymer-forming cytoskeletal [mine drainage metagenome]|uniref:Polymer-forming cytoskeletal n=1 Tax=mine drainage metagenome TaxID=410659 RepID=A0A1J5PZM2_9ZZZZ
MFNRKKQPPIKSLIAHGCQIDGCFSFVEGLRVDGALTGNISCKTEQPSILVISESAVVIGAIDADHIIINGRVDGPVNARVMLELQPKARIVGDVTYKALEMHQGATVVGRLNPIQAGTPSDEKTILKLTANDQ